MNIKDLKLTINEKYNEIVNETNFIYCSFNVGCIIRRTEKCACTSLCIDW